MLSAFGLEKAKADYGTLVAIQVSVPQTTAEEFEQAIRDATSARAHIEIERSGRSL